MALDRTVWQGRVDSDEAGNTLRLHQTIQDFDDAVTAPALPASAVIGFCSDAGVLRNHGRPGAAQGPDAIRCALAGLPVHDAAAVFDAGNVVCAGDALEDAQQRLGTRVAEVLQRGMRPVVLGGGHEVAFGTFSGLAQYLGDRLRSEEVLIVNFDAHFDLRAQSVGSSGTPFWQIANLMRQRGGAFHYWCLGVSRYSNTSALFERATQLGVQYWLDRDMSAAALPRLREQLARRLETTHHVYLTIDLDVLPGEKAPGVSAPAAYGVSLEVIEALADVVRACGKLRVADIAEYNPLFDRDQLTARVAARLALPLLTQI